MHMLLCKNFENLILKQLSYKIDLSFSFDKKLVFIDSFQVLSSLLDNLVTDFSENDFQDLSHYSDDKVLDLVGQKVFYPYEYLCDFEKFKEKLPEKTNFLIH